jgi:hypothetical protein
MADEETTETEGEQSWTDSVSDWAEQTWEDVTGGDEAPAEEGPISVPYTEPTPEEEARLQQQSDLSDLITSVCNALESQVEAVHQQASILSGSVATTSHDECSALAGQCFGVSGNGYASAAQLTGAGVQDWVYSVKACNEVGFWANSAGNHATAAASADTDTTMGMSLNSAKGDLFNALSSIRGA